MGEALEGRGAAPVVRRRRRFGGDLVVDGPFAETKEQLSAFCLLE
jgi:hypothetical protein